MVKKILYFVLVLLISISSINVYASNIVFDGVERIDDVYYVKASKNLTQYRIGMIIANTSNGKIAYCIEPFSALTTEGNYEGTTSYNNAFNISESDWERIKLLSYYGYGYGNHTDSKWFSVTQIMIWRTIDKTSSFNWLNNLSEKRIIYPYENEIQELERLVNNHYVLPDIPSEIHMTLNDTIVLEDKNSVLGNYTLVSTNSNDYIDGNLLYLSENGEEEREIELVKKGDLNEPAIFYYNANSQNTLERGNFSDIKTKMKIKVYKGSITIEKIDEDSNSIFPKGEGELTGSKFEVIDEENNIKEIVIGKNSTIDNLALGRYVVKEVESGKGYMLNSNEYEVILTEENKDITLKIANKIKEAKLIIYKYYGSYEEFKNNTMKKEPNVSFEIYDKDDYLVDTITTNNEGTSSIILPFGNYKVKQINSLDGYEIVGEKNITIDGDKDIVLTLNDYEIEVPNAAVDLKNACQMLLEEFF